ncbi:lysosomal alpha-glucosidase-like isoform X2 [Tachypleus tridentatus]|uniref:lysosomal alpha-glucosidase-like isoform X2 n=1 Tax=Tachypleus tridentatus TaxID=6853 RepID=UPI003FD48305
MRWFHLTLVLIILSLVVCTCKQQNLWEENSFSQCDSDKDSSCDSQPRKQTHWLSEGLKEPPACNFVPEERIDCVPEANPTPETCRHRDCCWDFHVFSPTSTDNLGRVRSGPPPCFYPPNHQHYKVKNVTKMPWGVQAVLRRTRDSGYPQDVSLLAMDIVHISKDTLRIKIYDAREDRYEVPIIDIPDVKMTPQVRDYEIQIQNDPISFKIIRNTTGNVLIDTSAGPLIFSNQYLQISTRLPSTFLYGLGEHRDHFLRRSDWKIYTLFNRGERPTDDPTMNMYGSHPFYLMLENDGNSHGVFLLNSNAMDVAVQPAPTLTYRVTGGIFDFFFFLGPTPDDVIQQYTNVIGRPFLPPYWTLGFHLSRFGYMTSEKVRTVWKRTRKAGIPYDTHWTDIDYMLDFKDFTYDRERYKGLPDLVNDLHEAGMYYVLNFSPALHVTDSTGEYPAYDEALGMDIFIRDINKKNLLGKLWPNVTAYLDFSNPKASEFWINNMITFHEKVPYDAAWIDMNEPYNFINGSWESCPMGHPLETPPYQPGNDTLATHTLCMSSHQYLSSHYNLHNIYSVIEAKTTYKALEILGKRPFILSRASFPGLGRYSGHWSGDIYSRWDYLSSSVPDLLAFNIFGVPFMGADICGFFENVTEDLCIRWIEVGAFYPFCRNHNDEDSQDQDPVVMGEKVIEIYKSLLTIRYFLLPYLYTLFYNSHTRGQPVVRPLLFDFPTDGAVLHEDRQFLWGKALMIIPVLEKDTDVVEVYFPRATWYDYYTGMKVVTTGRKLLLDAPLGKINLAVRGGNIIPAQEVAQTTKLSRNNPFHLLVALSEDGEADGDLYWDDGECQDPIEKETYNLIRFTAKRQSIMTSVIMKGYMTTMDISTVWIYGVMEAPSRVMINSFPAIYQYDTETKLLKIVLKDVSLLHDNLLEWM